MVEGHPGSDALVHTPVLIVDSDEASRAGLRSALEGAGYTVHEATTGVDAIVVLYIAKERLTVVVESYLSDMDGEDFLHLVTHDEQLVTRHGYVFLAGQSASSAVTSRFLAHNGIVRLVKPFTLEALTGAVANASLSVIPAG
jgi:two-component system cell cycle sensor histidine kinase/response regulator CckA